jgi:cell division protein FtsX
VRRLRPVGTAAALACTALLAGCGGGHFLFVPSLPEGPAQVNPALRGHGAVVKVYFCTPVECAKGATRHEERLVGERLRREPCVRRIVFTSKAQAFAKFRKQHPKLVGAMPAGVGNPLPDSFTVTPDKPSCAATIAAAARADHWPGVQQISVAHRR